MGRRVYGIYPGINDVLGLAQTLLFDKKDVDSYDLVWDDKEPEILFVSEGILSDHGMLEQFKRLYSSTAICVFAPGECILPDLNVFDYGIGYACRGSDDRIVRRPNRRFLSSFITKWENPIKDTAQAQKLLDEKKGFCNFIYSNPNGHSNRKMIFDILSEYKRVDSYGAFLNNMGLVDSGGDDLTALVKNSTDIKSRYKFSIAFENACFPGYTSEKVYTSLEAGTIPIYWGNPLVNRDLNPEAIICCSDRDSFKTALEKVRQIDEDDELWCQMIMQPWLSDEQLKIEKEESDLYYSFLQKLFTDDLESLKRKPEGTWPGHYKDFWIGRQAGTDKFKVNFEIASSMCELIQQGRNLSEGLETDISSVAVYGMGRIGKILYEDLKRRDDITIPFCIDNRVSDSGTDAKTIKLSELGKLSAPDLVIVTVSSEYDIIRDSILSICDTKVISIQELLDKCNG